MKLANKQNVFSIILLSLLSACNGGGSGGGNPPSPPQPPSGHSLLPLNITVSDLNNNPLPNDTIDVYKIGQVLKYKLTFTNPNSFVVSRPQSDGGAVLFQDLNWADVHHQNNQPGTFGEITGNYYKTTNADDCFNVSQLNPGKSCSFYTIAMYAYNSTTEENFTYPLSYVINEISKPENKLVVEQCQKRYPGAVPQYDCSNETKPEYANQFIKYKLVSTTTGFPFPSHLGYQFSNDGNIVVYCTQDTPTTCYRQSVTYNGPSNLLSYSTLSSFTTFGIDSQGIVSSDGASFFGTLTLSGGIYRFINSINPNVPSIDSIGTNSLKDFEKIQGLDNSIIINNTGSGRAYKYDPLTNRIPDIKVDGKFASYIYGVASDGTIITQDHQHNLRCANSTDGINFTSRPMINFVLPTSYADYMHNLRNDSRRAFNIHNVFYGYQDLTQNDATGKAYIKQGAFFKIKVDKNNCSIAIADANTISVSDMTFQEGIGVYDDFVSIGSKLTSSNNTAIGFN